MLLTVTIPSGKQVGQRRVIGRGTPTEIERQRLIAYTNNPTLEYREVASHNGEQVGDLLDALLQPKRPTKRKAANGAEPTTWPAWNRKYPNVQAWIDAHPGKMAGQFSGPSPVVSVTYYTTPGGYDGDGEYHWIAKYADGTTTGHLPNDAVIWDSLADAINATEGDHRQREREEQAAA